MKQRSFGDLLFGAILGGALAIGGLAWAGSGMMNGGMMGMHKMMETCNQMMETMQTQHGNGADPNVPPSAP